MEPNTSHKKTGIAIASIIGILIATVVVFAGTKKDDDQIMTPDTVDTTPVVVTQPSVPTPPTKTPTTQPPVSTVYKNGTYSTSATYMSPGGMDTLKVTLTLKDDIVVDSTVTGSGDNTSKRYQDMFIAGYKQYVVGKNLASINIGKVSGSSLTPHGFNAALLKIKAQAKA